MSDAHDDKRSRRAWELAGRQHGVITRRQLLALGFDTRSIEHRLARGRLHPVMRGVYAVGWPRLTRERRWMAATLACGDGAVLSHRSAAALWGIGAENPGRIDVSVTRRCSLLRPGLHIRSRPTLALNSVVSRSGIPVTDPAQTLVDLATELPPLQMERTVNEADKRATWSEAPARPSGQANLSPVRLRPGGSLSPYCSLCRASPAAHQTAGQRLRSRLLLARPGPGRRDARPPIPPNAIGAGARRTPGPCPRPRRDEPAPLHPLRDQVRTRPSTRHASQGRRTSTQALRALTPLRWGKNAQRCR